MEKALILFNKRPLIIDGFAVNLMRNILSASQLTILMCMHFHSESTRHLVVSFSSCFGSLVSYRKLLTNFFYFMVLVLHLHLKNE